MANGIRIQFLGGANEVGKLAMLLEMDGTQLLFEYGMSPGKPPTYPMPPPPVDMTLLTHAHLDHSGMIPWLCSQSDQRILATDLTNKITNVLFKDSVKIAKMEGYAPPFKNRDVKDAEHCFDSVRPGQTMHLGDTRQLRIHSAGHIPGSLMFELIGSRSLLFTGDFNVIDTRLVTKAAPVPCSVLCMEGTYAGREHPKREELERMFLDKIDEVVRRGGIVVIPAFAVARSQEVAMVLREAGLNVWFDGMGQKVTRIFLKHKETLRSAGELKKAFNAMKLVHSDQGRKMALKSEVIITSSGMMDGGPVLSYMNKLKDDPKSAVLLTGYQVEGTNSKLLVDKGKLNFYGVMENVACEAAYFDFSAHAGHSELVDFARACNPEKIVLFHSDDRQPLAESLRDYAEVLTPKDGEQIIL